nr:hypothetical protein SHINE37_40816 [Rhizobiaceae bacterium]
MAPGLAFGRKIRIRRAVQHTRSIGWWLNGGPAIRKTAVWSQGLRPPVSPLSTVWINAFLASAS